MTELDELWMKVAQALGYIDNGVTNDDAHEFYLLSPGGRQYFYINGLPGADAPLPNWTKDIAAAWPLVDMVMAAGGGFNVTFVNGVGRYYCEFYAAGRGAGSGETASEAICAAFLAWKEAQP